MGLTVQWRRGQVSRARYFSRLQHQLFSPALKLDLVPSCFLKPCSQKAVHRRVKGTMDTVCEGNAESDTVGRKEPFTIGAFWKQNNTRCSKVICWCWNWRLHSTYKLLNLHFWMNDDSIINYNLAYLISFFTIISRLVDWFGLCLMLKEVLLSRKSQFCTTWCTLSLTSLKCLSWQDVALCSRLLGPNTAAKYDIYFYDIYHWWRSADNNHSITHTSQNLPPLDTMLVCVSVSVRGLSTCKPLQMTPEGQVLPTWNNSAKPS